MRNITYEQRKVTDDIRKVVSRTREDRQQYLESRGLRKVAIDVRKLATLQDQTYWRQAEKSWKLVEGVLATIAD